MKIDQMLIESNNLPICHLAFSSDEVLTKFATSVSASEILCFLSISPGWCDDFVQRMKIIKLYQLQYTSICFKRFLFFIFLSSAYIPGFVIEFTNQDSYLK